MGDSTPFPSPAAIARAELFTRERFVYDGETLEDALAPGSARRRALDAALEEIEDGAKQPSVAVAPPVLAAARARAPALRGGAPPGRRDGALGPPGGCTLGDADRTARRGAAQPGTATARRRPPSRRRTGRRRRRLGRRRRGRGRRRADATATRTATRTRPRTRASTRSPRTGRTTPRSTRTSSSTSSPRTPTPTGGSGSSTRPARGRRWLRSASSRLRAPAAC